MRVRDATANNVVLYVRRVPSLLSSSSIDREAIQLSLASGPWLPVEVTSSTKHSLTLITQDKSYKHGYVALKYCFVYAETIYFKFDGLFLS